MTTSTVLRLPHRALTAAVQAPGNLMSLLKGSGHRKWVWIMVLLPPAHVCQWASYTVHLCVLAPITLLYLTSVPHFCTSLYLKGSTFDCTQDSAPGGRRRGVPTGAADPRGEGDPRWRWDPGIHTPGAAHRIEPVVRRGAAGPSHVGGGLLLGAPRRRGDGFPAGRQPPTLNASSPSPWWRDTFPPPPEDRVDWRGCPGFVCPRDFIGLLGGHRGRWRWRSWWDAGDAVGGLGRWVSGRGGHRPGQQHGRACREAAEGWDFQREQHPRQGGAGAVAEVIANEGERV